MADESSASREAIVNVFTAHYRFMLNLLIALAIATVIGAVAYFAWYRPKAQREKLEHHSQASGASGQQIGRRLM